MAESVDTKYENLSQREHILKRMNLYLGSKNETENIVWVINKNTDQLEKETISYSIALINSIYESLQNTVDHCLKTKSIKGLNKCDTIKLNFNHETGEISVFNNGQGIKVEKFNNTDQYIIEVIFSEYLSGSNFNNDAEIKIGANGLGIKLLNTVSEYFIVETSDAINKMYYTQKFENNNSIKNKPVIEKFTKISKEQKVPHTKITFLPDYKLFNTTPEKIKETLDKLLFTYLTYISVYLGDKYNIYYNEELITKNKLTNLSESILDKDDIITCKLANKNNKKDDFLEINIGIYDSNDGQEHLSLINGLYVSNGGTHIRYINKLILDNLKTKLEKKLKDKVKITNKLISNFLFIFIKGDLNHLEFKNQCKNEISVSETRFKDYEFDQKVYKQIWSKLETEFDRIYLDKISKENVTKKTSKMRGILKYRSADKAGTSESLNCTLVVPEGDSAESCVRNGLTSNKALGYKYFGIFNIQGVPLNVRKEIDIKEIKKNGHIEYIIDKKKKLMENERINSLIKVMNLNYSYTYDLTPKGEEEYKTLRYGKVLIATDADVDGLGMICSLILNFFNVFFPKLLERKVINIFSTPLIRAYPNKKNKYLEEFYNIEEYNEWLEKVNINDYKINYIKGLAGHSNMEIKYMFKEFNKNIYKFKLDEKANDYFEIYFGNDADKRKVILAGKDEYEEEEYKENYKNKIISCSYQLNTNTKEFQLDNIQRKMPHIIDGLNPARRKVLAGAIKKFKQSNSTIKVFQLGGYIAEHMMYHHGSDSLNKTIITMAQNFSGSRNIPLLLPIGQFGSRYKGGDDAGSARYISTKLNKSVVELLYPIIDNDLLEYHIIDGELAEPKYFIPILPTVLLEDISLPSTGWKIEVYARDIEQVINNVKNLINNESSKISKMKYFKNKFKGKEVKNKNVNMLIGLYEIPKNSKDTIIINELPPKVWNEKFIDSLEKKEFIDEVLDESTIDDVRIIVNFKKGELNKLISEYQEHKNYSEYLDAVEYNLNLYIKLSHHINFYQINNAVKEYKNYETVIMDWFYIRKDCYIKRIDRELILLKYKIMMLENIIRFIENHEQYNISKKSDSIANTILKDNCYIKLNTSIINSPGLLCNEDLENHILNINQSYDYLLNLSYRKMNDQSYENNKKKLKELQKQLKYYQQPGIYKEIWIGEIDSLHKELKDKFKNGFYQEDENLFKRK
jgi:DNA topoisomerase-2